VLTNLLPAFFGFVALGLALCRILPIGRPFQRRPRRMPSPFRREEDL
jgi:hypothetical protein